MAQTVTPVRQGFEHHIGVKEGPMRNAFRVAVSILAIGFLGCGGDITTTAEDPTANTGDPKADAKWYAGLRLLLRP